MIREAQRDVQCDLETTKEERVGVGVEAAEPPIDARSKCTHGDAASFLPLPVKRIITVLVFHFQTPVRNKTRVIYWLIMSAGGHRLGKETEFSICENRIVAKSYLPKLNPWKKCFFLVVVLPFRQQRGCPLCGINKIVI